MINIDINSNGFASGDAWSVIQVDPTIVDTYVIRTNYPDNYTTDKYKMQYMINDTGLTSERIELDANGDVSIPSDLVEPNKVISCKFIITLIADDIDVLTSSYELTLTYQASSYLNPDADKFIVVPTFDSMLRLPSDFLANGKVIKVVHDKNYNQDTVYYYYDAVTRSFVRDPDLNKSARATPQIFVADDESSMTSLTDVEVGALVYRRDKKVVYALEQLPASDASNWQNTAPIWKSIKE